MKIFVISDLHCSYKEDFSKSYDTLLISNKPRNPVNQHPVAALLDLIKKKEITADILVCPGDLSDKADSQGIISSWSFLQEIRDSLKAELLIGIPGNHDVNSRGTDPFSFIKSFHNDFPVPDQILKNKFWELKYCVLTTADTFFLLINTVHSHTNAELAKESKLDPETLERIKAELEASKPSKYLHRVCIMHHHPIKHSNIKNWKDSDSVDKGDELISLLSQYSFNIVIHGHKHQPRLVEASSLPILAAGSFSCYVNLALTGLQLMFHIIDLEEGSRQGNIESWEFELLNGWTQNQNKNFPPRVGFGAIIDVAKTATEINQIFTSQGSAPMFYDTILARIPCLKYLVPDKLLELNNTLKDVHNIQMTPEYPLDPIRLSTLIKN